MVIISLYVVYVDTCYLLIYFVLDGHLYTATAADFSGSDPLIYREPVRTERSDLRLLNDPSFVSAVASTSHVYFFYRETAVEYMNCGKVR